MDVSQTILLFETCRNETEHVKINFRVRVKP
jgi:hypothetical protein